MVSGVLFALALPPFDREFLGWFALAPLLVAVCVPGRRALHAVGLGMVAGIGAGIVQIRGGDGIAPDRLSFSYLPFIWIALVFGVTAALAGEARKRWPIERLSLWPLFVACAGVAVEWLTTLSPLPVGIALCQYRNLPLIQIASVTGIWGVSFLLWLTNAALADAILCRRVTKAVGVSVALVGGVVLLGGLHLMDTRDVLVRKPLTTVAAIQDFSGTDGANPDGTRGGADLPDTEALVRQAARDGARLIVGSEEALGRSFTPEDPGSDSAKLARETGRCLVVGYQQPGKEKDFNCAALIGTDGVTRGVHRKIHLFLGERNAVEAGSMPTVVESGDSAIGRVGLLICFDTCWTALVRAEAAQGARIIALPNYDPPTPCAVLHHLHTALMPFRAVENGVAIVRADPNGRSLVVDGWGAIVSQASLYEAEAVVGEIHLTDGGTVFTQWGDWLAYLSATACAAVPLLLVRRKPATPAAEPQAGGEAE